MVARLLRLHAPAFRAHRGVRPGTEGAPCGVAFLGTEHLLPEPALAAPRGRKGTHRPERRLRGDGQSPIHGGHPADVRAAED